MKAGEIPLATPSSRFILGIIPWYGALIVLGAALAIWMADREASHLGLPKDTMIDLAFWVLPLGILGARIYYVLFSWPTFATHPISVLYIWNGGLAIYGGLIAGFMTIYFFCKDRNLAFRSVLDILIPGVALAQAMGRWGNYFNQEAYGLSISAESGLAFFPMAVLIQETSGPGWHLATFFYESIWDLLIFSFLCYGRRRLFRKQGDVFLFYILLYAAGRLVIENLRMDSLYWTGGIRISQLLSILICIGCVCYLYFREREMGYKIIFRRFIGSVNLITALIALAVSLNLSIRLISSRKMKLILLGAFSFVSILHALILYGKSTPSEVLYAYHKA